MEFKNIKSSQKAILFRDMKGRVTNDMPWFFFAKVLKLLEYVDILMIPVSQAETTCNKYYFQMF